MKNVREDTFAYLEKKNITCIPSEANFFMMEVNRPGMEFAKAMTANKVIIGRVWPTIPPKSESPSAPGKR
jgi:histidinol-phosphate aminotransferase